MGYRKALSCCSCCGVGGDSDSCGCNGDDCDDGDCDGGDGGGVIELVLPNIKMNPPQVYMCSPS